MRKCIPVLLLLFVSLSASADSTPHWIELHSPHFTVITNSSDKDARRVAVQFERMRALFHVLLPAASDDAAAPIVVLALKDKKSFRSLEPSSYIAQNQLELAGLFVNAQNKNYVLLRLDAEGEHPFSTVYHEYTHYMLRKSAEWIPIWLNEGLAEFYQNTTLEEKNVRVGQPSPDDILYLRQNRLIPLTTLLQVDHDSPYYHDEQKGSVFYAESWALVHYLEITDYQNKTHRLQDYSNLLIQHKDSLTAAQTAFGDLKKLEHNLNSYVGGFSFQEFRMLVPVPFAESSFDIQPLSTTQADAVRADVLLDVNRPKDSEALLQAVLQEDPKNAFAHEIMGELKFRDRDVPAAQKWYSEAVRLDSHSYLAHYYFGVMTLQSGDRSQDDAVERSLVASTKLNPKFAPAFDALAQFYTSRHEKLDEAHVANLTAVTLEPANLGYRINTAQTLMENDQPENALLVLNAARRLAKTLEETGMLEHRIGELEQFEASAARYKNQNGQAASSSQANETVSISEPDPTSKGPIARPIASDGTVTVEVSDNSVSAAPGAPTEELAYPTGAPIGPHRIVAGVLHGVECPGDTLLTLTLDQTARPGHPSRPIALYASNYFKVSYTTLNFEPTGDLNPCNAMEGMKAKVEYGEVNDKRVAGEILSIELSK